MVFGIKFGISFGIILENYGYRNIARKLKCFSIEMNGYCDVHIYKGEK